MESIEINTNNQNKMMNLTSVQQRRRKLCVLFGALLVAQAVLFLMVVVVRVECAALLGNSQEHQDSDSSLASHHQQQQQQQQQQQPTIRRFRRQVANKLQQQLELDDQTMKRQLPELIAQAHQDKTMERALLRMLISASLRSGLSSGNAPTANQRPLSANWQLDHDTTFMDSGSELVPNRLARLEQSSGGALDGVDLSSLMATINQFNAAQLQPLDQGTILGQTQQQYPVMDKREYIKPCSFNAISCVRTPFRKL